MINVTGPAKVKHLSAKKLPIFSLLLSHNLQNIFTNRGKDQTPGPVQIWYGPPGEMRWSLLHSAQPLPSQ